MVNIGLRVLHRPNMAQLPTVYRNLGKDYEDRVLPSIMNEVCSFCMYIMSVCVCVCVCLCMCHLDWNVLL